MGKLTLFLKDGRLEIDNNRSERSVDQAICDRVNELVVANTPRNAKGLCAHA
jgi:hypothetical protein